MARDIIPKQPIILNFDPMTGNTKKVFEDPAARTLYLLWRPFHLINQNFTDEVLAFAKYFWEHRPTNEDQFVKLCLRTLGGGGNFFNLWCPPQLKEDFRSFWPFFRNDCDNVKWETKIDAQKAP